MDTIWHAGSLIRIGIFRVIGPPLDCDKPKIAYARTWLKIGYDFTNEKLEVATTF